MQSLAKSLGSISIAAAVSLPNFSSVDRLLRSIISSSSPSLSLYTKPRLRHLNCHRMDVSPSDAVKDAHLGKETGLEDEYEVQSKLLHDFTNICNIDRAWIVKSDNGRGSAGLFSISQPNLLANKRRKFVLSVNIFKESDKSIYFHWAPFPIELASASAIVPSPTGGKFLVVKNPENDSPTVLEIWSQCQLEKEFQIPLSIHGSLYIDKWFEGISWSSDEAFIAYVAEEPAPPKPSFNSNGYKRGSSNDKDRGSWKGQGDFVEEWGETYAGKTQPALFVLNADSGEVQAVKGIPSTLSIGQVVWAPTNDGKAQYLVGVGWSYGIRKLGIKYCYNRSCGLYAVWNPFFGSISKADTRDAAGEDPPIHALTQSISSAFFPRFSPDGKYLLFLSAKGAVDSGAHCATNSLHRIEWPADENFDLARPIFEVIPIITSSEEGGFPGLYCPSILDNPWLADGNTMILDSFWHSSEAVIAVDILSGNVSRISPTDTDASWSIIALDGDNIIAVSSSPTELPKVKYGYLVKKNAPNYTWSWSDVSSPIFKCPEKVETILSSLQFSVMKIPVEDISCCTTEGAKKDFEAIFLSSKSEKGEHDPLIVILHGGPHSVSITSYSKLLAFLASLGFSLLIVNYRGSLGFGEDALQSLPGKIGSQDVSDVLTAIDHTINLGLADPSKIAVLGGSHGGFLTTHLIGQAPDRFAAAATRNPVCNLASMVGTTDIPDWVFFEVYGHEGKNSYTEAPTAGHLNDFHSKSPISHVDKVKTPTLFLLGAQDLRVPVSNGLQYVRALKEKGVEVKLIVFPNDVHGIDKPQSDFESFLNIGVWFKMHLK
ncbi:hypothetical protein MLD38_036210 [Melastoma candidum]|uniref:Uncharacterized protein n=1 Tax=Melastoma candidum TaxID=119954 RepID=A0ACB9LJ06_9MYRT|nr:hypothetical protein MLD38_036210 [Melastoma candidum]